MAAAVQPRQRSRRGAKARQLKSQGIHIYDFSSANPIPTSPAHINAAAHKAMLEGQTHYTPPADWPRSRAASHAGMARPTASIVKPEQVIVSNGAKHSLHNALAAMVGPGDEVHHLPPLTGSATAISCKMTGGDVSLVVAARRHHSR